MGGGGPTQSTVTQSNLPEYAKPYYKNLMNRAQRESTTDYQRYKGDRIADMDASTNTALNQATAFGNSQVGGANSIGDINNVASKAGNLSYDPSNYMSQQMGFGVNGLDRVGTSDFDQSAAQKYMSPYMDAVVNRAQSNAQETFNQQQAQRNLGAAKAGSFGGSRAAVQNSIANNQLNNQMTDIFVNGQQSAFENAQSQFNTDRARDLQAQTQNQNTALTYGQSNQGAALDAAKLNEQSRQFGSNLGLQGLDLQRQAAMDRMNVYGQQDDMTQARIQAMLGAGQTREEYGQKELDQKYANFVNQRDSERQNLQFLSSILQGVPISANREVMSSTSQNNLAGMLGSLGGLSSLNGMSQS